MATSVDGRIYYQEKGESADGNPITAYIESAPLDLGDGDRLMRLLRVVPDFEDLTGGLSITLRTRRFPQAPPVDHGPYAVAGTTEKIDLRLTARQMAVRIDSTSAPSFWRLGAVRVDQRESGQGR